jgi:hypothetical protein
MNTKVERDYWLQRCIGLGCTKEIFEECEKKQLKLAESQLHYPNSYYVICGCITLSHWYAKGYTALPNTAEQSIEWFKLMVANLHGDFESGLYALIAGMPCHIEDMINIWKQP